MPTAIIAHDKPRDKYRLPLGVKPTHYDVTIRTDLEKLTFDGFVKIEYVRIHQLSFIDSGLIMVKSGYPRRNLSSGF